MLTWFKNCIQLYYYEKEKRKYQRGLIEVSKKGLEKLHFIGQHSGVHGKHRDKCQLIFNSSLTRMGEQKKINMK